MEKEILKNVEKSKDRLANILYERNQFLGIYKERVLVALTEEEVKERLIYPEVKKALEKVVATKMVLTRRVDMKYLKKYINLANMYKVDCKIVDGLSYVGNISLVVSADDAVDIKRNPVVKSRLEIIKDRGMPLAYYEALGKKVSKRYLKIIKKLLPELLDQYKELTFFDRLCGEKCPLEEKLGGKIYG
ncbi:DUF1694 domain-containing protein [Sneathia sanguinegens]|uniref:DUF1694 domain-containing protein n=1 Tax=Sneathia sanguinegens TaxID=40543 RepID=A0ABT7HJ16_9FUSO|nr:DUF1694 domain-containing protein [Sneathia sanguinegens]MDK9580514.1 DUF1694 domain-containing protein [Sneathia sanguinegens]